MRRILMFVVVLFCLCSCGNPPVQTTDVIINVTGTSVIELAYSNYSEKINVNGFYSNTFSPPVGSKFSLKWESENDVVVQIIHDDKCIREGKGKNGEIIFDATSSCFIKSLRRTK